MAVPLVVCFMLVIPVVVVWLRQKFMKTREKKEKKYRGNQDLEMQDKASSKDLGLRWVEIGFEPEIGEKITNDRLAEGLSSKLRFTQAEFDQFGQINLSPNVYIEVDDRYFKPVMDADWDDRFESTVDVFWNNLM